MKYNDLKLTKFVKGKRVGRGIAAGQGKTAGRGTKGQGSRTGSSAKPGFSGGQNKLMQQLPKLPGFTSHRTKSEAVYTGELDQFGKTVIDNKALAAAGLISSEYINVKLLANGEVTKPVTVKLQAASSSSIEAVQKAGGSFEVVVRPSRPKTSTKTRD